MKSIHFFRLIINIRRKSIHHDSKWFNDHLSMVSYFLVEIFSFFICRMQYWHTKSQSRYFQNKCRLNGAFFVRWKQIRHTALNHYYLNQIFQQSIISIRKQIIDAFFVIDLILFGEKKQINILDVKRTLEPHWSTSDISLKCTMQNHRHQAPSTSSITRKKKKQKTLLLTKKKKNQQHHDSKRSL